MRQVAKCNDSSDRKCSDAAVPVKKATYLLGCVTSDATFGGANGKICDGGTGSWFSLMTVHRTLSGIVNRRFEGARQGA
jgi:hypothetical protein